MKSLKFVSFVILAAVVVMVLAACGSSGDPVKSDSIPVYAGAKATTDPAMLQFADTVTKSLKDSLGSKFSDPESKVFTTDKSVKFEDVSGYYDTELTKAGWVSNPALVFNDPNARVKAYIRGTQAVFVLFVSNDALPQNILMTLLAMYKP